MNGRFVYVTSSATHAVVGTDLQGKVGYGWPWTKPPARQICRRWSILFDRQPRGMEEAAFRRARPGWCRWTDHGCGGSGSGSATS